MSIIDASARIAPLHALQEVALAQSTGSAEAVAEVVVLQARALLGVDAAVVFRWDEDTGLLKPLAETHSTVAEEPLNKGEGAVGRAFESRSPVLVEDYQSWDEAVPTSVTRGVVSVLAVPLLVHDRPTGALAVWTYSRRHFKPAEVELLSLFASHVGLALDSARLTQTALQQAESDLLRDLAREGIGQDVDSALQLITKHACALTGADYAVVSLNDHLSRQWHGMWGGKSDFWRSAKDSADRGLTSRVLESGWSVLIEKLDEEPGYPDDYPLHASEGGVTALALPMTGSRQREAVLEIGWRRTAAVGDRQVQLLETVAAFGAIVIDAAYAHAELSAHAAELAASEQRFRSLYETIACGVMVKNQRGEIIELNEAAQQMLGVRLGDALGKQSEDLWDAFDEDGYEIPHGSRASRAAMTSGRSVRGMVMRLVREDGWQRWVQVDSVPVIDPDGNVRQVVSSFIDISERKRVEEALRLSEAALVQQALHDGLTGLPNRGLLNDRLRHAIARGTRDTEGFAVLYLDLNGFKWINDNLGHDVGDQVLREISGRLFRELRQSDTVARMGGDEFAIVLPGIGDERGVATAARKVLEAIARPIELGGREFTVTAAIGAAIYPQHGLDAKSLIRKADMAMYEAKRTGDPGYSITRG